ncbi:bifunctional adenosylcobinamide kinase/adenosylcobinamide-phosphate guanylyltransferase [Propionicicella superfundia]|uniref:bifunctional adenosylcobinamide kinase/adenosylcobinamide-phosphate guanylyltransferase n=1 Tax=Propionicicella superfundia TaxID=348582 RepID=UPI0003FBEF40|nr:bifunctional adenosylcobinamide kinase/adenosylcobinamide-phosphate guanylyltransferase [Propionicicella superfundia]
MHEHVGRVLVTGGVRSGKSRYAEDRLRGAPAVTYVATGYPADPDADPEWALRVARHQSSRPQTWRTVETLDIAAVLEDATGPVLIDCFGLWVTRTLDSLAAWDAPRVAWEARWAAEVDRLTAAWARCPLPVLAVTNEVGWGVVPDHRAGRLFADGLGRLNQRLAETADEVVLMVAGRPLRL